MLRAVIVDDEKKSRRILNALIKDYCPDVQIVGMAEDVLSGVKLIHQVKPDLVFLDIEMPNYTGFKLIDFFEDIQFDIVFTTAYEEYAIKAFKLPITGYLMKPIDIDDLQGTIARIQNKKSISIAKQTKPLPKGKLTLPTQDGLLYALPDEIMYIESEGRYTKVYLIDGSMIVTTKNLKELTEQFKGTLFVRIHRSFIINLTFINKYSKGVDSYVQLENKTRIDVGKKFKENLSEAISAFLK